MLKTATTPKCTRSMPSALAVGMKIGRMTRMMVLPSSRQPEHQQDDVHPEQEHRRGEVVAGQQAPHGCGDLLDGHHVVEDERSRDEHADRGGRAGAVEHRQVRVADRYVAIPEDGDEERIGGGNRRRLGRGHDAAVDAPEQDHRHQQRGHGSRGDARPLAQRYRLLHREVVAMCLDRVDHHLCDRHQQPRDDPAEEQIADGRIRDQRVEHHRDRRRDDRSDHGRCRRDGSGVAHGIAVVAGHHVDADASRRREVRNRRARHAGKDDALDDVDMAEAASETANQHVAKAQELVRHLADVHQLGGEQKERYCEQNVAVVQAVQDLLGRRSQIEVGEQEIEDRAGDHRIADRQSEQAKPQDGADADREGAGAGHSADPLPISMSGGWPRSARQVSAAYRAITPTENTT